MRIFLTLLLLLLPWPAWGLNLGLGTAHYAEAMEFYYQRPRPGLLAPMLKKFSEQGVLARAEKRMFVAAFLATLARRQGLDLNALLPEPDHDQKLTLAWSLHLAGRDTSEILTGLAPAFANQIKNTPADLHAWDPTWEASVLGMYWAAFMASGDKTWLDAIIKAALREPVTDMGEKAAATLYDYAPGHAAILKELRKAVKSATSRGKQRLGLIIRHATGK